MTTHPNHHKARMTKGYNTNDPDRGALAVVLGAAVAWLMATAVVLAATCHG